FMRTTMKIVKGSLVWQHLALRPEGFGLRTLYSVPGKCHDQAILTRPRESIHATPLLLDASGSSPFDTRRPLPGPAAGEDRHCRPDRAAHPGGREEILSLAARLRHRTCRRRAGHRQAAQPQLR